jgi:hypothetical protein
VPESILVVARPAAERDGVSLNQFINTAPAEKVFTQRAARADKARFLEVLERLGSEAPRQGDRVAGWMIGRLFGD